MEISKFNIIMDYYQAVWKHFDIKKLEEIFDQCSEFKYGYIDSDKVNIKIYDRIGAFNNYHKPWFEKCKISSTKVLAFNIDDLTAEYEIYQTHDNQVYHMKFKDTFEIKNGKITQLFMSRIYKYPITV